MDKCDGCPFFCVGCSWTTPSGIDVVAKSRCTYFDDPANCHLTPDEFVEIEKGIAGEGNVVCVPPMELKCLRLLNALLSEANVYEMKTTCLCGEQKISWLVTDHSDEEA